MGDEGVEEGVVMMRREGQEGGREGGDAPCRSSSWEHPCGG